MIYLGLWIVLNTVFEKDYLKVYLIKKIED
nr:MAG TPA: hypothetical protein [Bacteriophage sp.]